MRLCEGWFKNSKMCIICQYIFEYFGNPMFFTSTFKWMNEFIWVHRSVRKPPMIAEHLFKNPESWIDMNFKRTDIAFGWNSSSVVQGVQLSPLHQNYLKFSQNFSWSSFYRVSLTLKLIKQNTHHFNSSQNYSLLFSSEASLWESICRNF